MKKNQQRVIYLPITGRDELNLIECPLTLLTDRAEENQKTLEFTDKQQGITRKWTISGTDKYGLPCALDEPVFIAMLALTKRDELKNQKVFFNQLEMLKLMKWPVSGQSYNRLELAFNRLSGVTIYTDYLWDQGEFKKGTFTLNIISESFLDKGKKKNSKNSWFEWGNRIFKSFLNGNLKNLNLDIYFDLKTPISKRFYRLWDKRLYKNGQISFDLKDLCHEKLGISRNLIYPSLLKQALKPALKEQKTKNLLSSTSYFKKKDGNWMLNIKRYRENPSPLPELLLPQPAEDQPQKEDSLLEQLFLLKIPTNKAKLLLQTYSRELIEGWIMALDMVKPQPRNRAGYLLKALEEKWELPAEVKERKKAEEREREEKLKADYDKYILAQVDEYLKTIDPQQIEKETEAHGEVFHHKYPRYEEFKGFPSIKPYIRYDYKMTIAEKLKLPTIEEWKSNHYKAGVTNL